ncbi:MAG: hypothetical protein ACPL6F_03990 [Anaerolineales bacterium]
MTNLDGACCLPKSNEVTYIKIGARQIVVGMRGLDIIFQQLALLQRNPEDASDRELVDLAGRYNYIPNSEDIEKDYAEALRSAYRAFLERQANIQER